MDPDRLARIEQDIRYVRMKVEEWGDPLKGPFAELGNLRVKVTGLLWFTGVMLAAVIGLAFK